MAYGAFVKILFLANAGLYVALSGRITCVFLWVLLNFINHTLQLSDSIMELLTIKGVFKVLLFRFNMHHDGSFSRGARCCVTCLSRYEVVIWELFDNGCFVSGWLSHVLGSLRLRLGVTYLERVLALANLIGDAELYHQIISQFSWKDLSRLLSNEYWHVLALSRVITTLNTALAKLAHCRWHRVVIHLINVFAPKRTPIQVPSYSLLWLMYSSRFLTSTLLHCETFVVLRQ